METIILKFGGTSVGSTDRISAVANIIKAACDEASPVVVVSAMSGETNRLIELANSFGNEPNKREFDALVSTGERVSASLVAIALNQLGLKAKSLSAAQIGMKTTANFSRAKIINLDKEVIFKTIEDGYIPIITGFQGITSDGDTTTMGRGGSDTTAVAIAASIKSKRCDIYTDVDGIYTTDPRIVPNAKKLDSINIEEMLELSGQGAKVMQIRAVEFAKEAQQAETVFETRASAMADYANQSQAMAAQMQERGMAEAVAVQQYRYRALQASASYQASGQEGQSMDRYVNNYAKQAGDYASLKQIEAGLREGQYTRAQQGKISEYLTRYNSQQFYERQPYMDPIAPFPPLPTLVAPAGPTMRGAAPRSGVSPLQIASAGLGGLNTALSFGSQVGKLSEG